MCTIVEKDAVSYDIASLFVHLQITLQSAPRGYGYGDFRHHNGQYLTFFRIHLYGILSFSS